MQVAKRLRQLRGDLDRAQASLALPAAEAAAEGSSPQLGRRRLEACLDAENRPDAGHRSSPPSQDEHASSSTSPQTSPAHGKGRVDAAPSAAEGDSQQEAEPHAGREDVGASSAAPSGSGDIQETSSRSVIAA